jgi:hypothetical protein
VPLSPPASFVDTEEEEHEVTWASVYARFNSVADPPFWPVLVRFGHEAAYYPGLEMAKTALLKPEEVQSVK